MREERRPLVVDPPGINDHADLAGTRSTAGDVAGDYTWFGMEHIWKGFDHLLFVFGLLLLVGGGRRLFWTITAFTLGHSVTLSLVTLGFLDFPVALVEFAIALSIFVLAVELTRTDRHDALWRNPWWLAGGFGLLHGMGFAGALAETGLLDTLTPLFRRATGWDLRAVAVGSGQALRMGERGDADVVLAHSQAAEEAFVAAGHGTRRRVVASNYFTIVGPPADPDREQGRAPPEGPRRSRGRGERLPSGDAKAPKSPGER